MDARRLTDDFSVSPQIEADSLSEIARAGYRSVLCNRPDDEEPGQTAYERIAAAAGEEGLEARSVPIVSGVITAEALEDFRAALDELPKPILAYCRSGTRCTMLWAITRHGEMDDAEIQRRAAEAGYDVSGILRQLGSQ
ncbi:TIGR01244 family sulfur transferase [Roseovarius salis]|uniref:TIGR01244 family sulfur transferase n=1 Tax=Roseovarius salis TaxID=3376063 RepID=UPI0037CA4261